MRRNWIPTGTSVLTATATIRINVITTENSAVCKQNPTGLMDTELEHAEEIADRKFKEQSLRIVTKFPRGCLTSDEAVKVILSGCKNDGVFDKDIAVGEGSP